MIKKTKGCGTLRRKHVGMPVGLAGWIDRVRDLGGVLFVTLRDRSGKVQLSFPSSLLQVAKKLSLHDVIAIQGVVQLRPEKDRNPKMATGDVEVLVEKLEILNTSAPLPLSIDDRDTVSEEVRLRYRYLDLHRQSMQQALEIRHRAMMAIRQFLHNEGFLEVETPILTKSTPEGARDYLVPSRIHKGKFYALPQSPQLFKQLLMIGGVEKYFQICRCFRDEDLRSDRQPEFTQVDIEMSFVDREDILDLTERLYAHLFRTIKGIELSLPFPRYTYEEVFRRYGTDKPDLRFGMELQEVSSLVQESQFQVFRKVLEQGGIVAALVAENGASYSRKAIQKLEAFVSDYGAKGLVWIKKTSEGISSPIQKFFSPGLFQKLIETLSLKEGDIAFLVADKEEVALRSLGALRNRLAKELRLIPQNTFSCLWVLDFPLFCWDDEQSRLVSEHHPFTAPYPEEEALLDKDPLKVRAQSYDIVVNGEETGGGSIRIHRRELQEKIFRLLGLEEEEVQNQFGFFLEALQYGAPPHGGIALGLDRLIMLFLGTEDIRDVIAFPKTTSASCLVTGAPSEVREEQLEELRLRIQEK